MAYATLRSTSGHEPIQVVEMDMDYCTLTYGVAPCTAAGAAGSECFNTKATTQDATNYNGSSANTYTYRFTQTSVIVPPTLDAIPLLESVSYTPTMITRGEGLGPRGKITCVFRDGPHDDRGNTPIDRYVDTRTYDPATQGTFWTKFLARNPYYQGRVMRLRSGFATEPWDWTNFEDRTFFIESISGPDANNRVTVTAKDILKLADDERAKAPALSTGYLAADMTAGQNTLDLAPTGIGASYDASGTVRVGAEVMTYTAVAADQLTGVVRGTDGTSAETHTANDAVQQCLRYTADTLDDVVEDLLVNYANISSSYITKADWTTEVTEWLASSQITTLITAPTGVRKLLASLCTVFMTDIWWDDVDEQIRMRVLKPSRATPDTVNDTSNVLADSFRQKADTDKRRTRIYIYYDYINATEPMTEERNFRRALLEIETDAEDATEYGDQKIERFFNRWTSNEGDALRLGTRTLQARRDTPIIYTWAMNVKDDYEIGDVVRLNVTQLRDATGALQDVDVLIIARKELSPSVFQFTAVYNGFAGRYAYIGPNTLNNYSAESDANKVAYGFIAEDAAPQLGGDGPYLII
jgi:hypothetical protein